MTIKKLPNRRIPFALGLSKHERVLPYPTAFTISRSYYSNSAAAIAAFVNLAVAETNQGYANTQIPITLALHCILDSGLTSSTSFSSMLNSFYNSAGTKDIFTEKQPQAALLLNHTTIILEIPTPTCQFILFEKIICSLDHSLSQLKYATEII